VDFIVILVAVSIIVMYHLLNKELADAPESAEARRKWEVITAAFNTLSDPQLRAAYDAGGHKQYVVYSPNKRLA
jgi:DnaJ-class molecular chaperone